MPVTGQHTQGNGEETPVNVVPSWVYQQLGDEPRPSNHLLEQPRPSNHLLQQLRELTGYRAPRSREVREWTRPDEPCPMFGETQSLDMVSSGSSSDEDVAGPQPLPSDFECPEPCCFLSVGQSFQGTQRLTQSMGRQRGENWQVNVRVQGCNWARGYVCGVMEALNVPQAKSPIITFWEGEIIDNVNNTFFTNKWNTSKDTDIQHWSKFDGFTEMKPHIFRHSGRSWHIAQSQYVYMRWKERFFVNVKEDCGLTIQGFYYVCLSRTDGQMMGYYYDPNSTPFQELNLRPVLQGQQGFSSSSYAFL